MHQSLELQYAPCDCESCSRLNLSADTPKDFSKVEKAGLEAFKKLYERGGYNPKDLLRVKEYIALVNETANAFGFAISHEVPEDMKVYLEKDGFIFSQLKGHAQLTEARSFLKDQNGNIVPYHEFEQKILKLNEKYNRHYLEAEYEFAVQSSQSAANWANLQTNTARYWLEYRTAGDERVRASHAALNGISLPADDEFWNSYYPPNGWRCRCVAVEVLARDYKLSDSAESIKKGEKATTHKGKSGKNTLEMFRFNPGKELKLFPPKNAYTKVVGADKVKEAQKIDRKAVREFGKNNLLTEYVKHKDLHSPIYFNVAGIKEFVNQPYKHEHEKLNILQNIFSVIEHSKYLGSTDFKATSMHPIKHILEIKVNGEKSWLILREDINGEITFYSISDSPKIPNYLKKK